jgi:Xaa-Pro aminopeptidase
MIDFKKLKIDALLVSYLPNVRYLTSFSGSNALVLLEPDAMTLITDPRYTLQAGQEAKQAKRPTKVVIGKRELWPKALALIKRKKVMRIGFEKSRLYYSDYKDLEKELTLGQTLEPVGDVIDSLRMVKNVDEIALIRRSVMTNSAAFDAVVKRIRPGRKESDIAAELDYHMRKHGAEGTAFETIVASGSHSALPHARPGPKAIGNNELLLIDMGAAQDGYMSDMTRTLFLGDPGDKARKLYRAVSDAQIAALAAVREGVTTRQVDQAARDVLKSAGYEKEFLHSTGHGLGLEIHEPPRVGKRDKTKLKANMVITIEPGAYLEGFGGVRIEDTVLVTKTGCEVLTPTSKELMVL